MPRSSRSRRRCSRLRRPLGALVGGPGPARTCSSTSCCRSPCSSPSSRGRRSRRGCRARSRHRRRRSPRSSRSSASSRRRRTGSLLLAGRRGRERVLELLPGDVALPRPEPVRTARRARDRVLLVALLYRKLGPVPGRRADRAAVRGALLLVLAVEPRRALRRHARRRRGRRRPQPSLVAAVTAVLVLVGGGASSRQGRATIRRSGVTSDRSRRIELTRKVFGTTRSSASASARSRARARPSRSSGGPPTLFVSHTTPLTVAAELGVIGLALYAALLAGAAVRSARATPRRRLRPRARRGLPRPLRPLAVLQRLLRGSRHVARARGRASSFLVAGRRPRHERRVRSAATARGCSSASLGALVALTCPRSAPIRGRSARRRSTAARPARPARPRRRRAGTSAWSARRPCSRALLVALAAAVGWRPRPGAWFASRFAVVVRCCSSPRRCSRSASATRPRPWFHTNDSTYQIELAGNLVRHGHNPYGHDYEGSGLERFYSRDGTSRRRRAPPGGAHATSRTSPAPR